PGGKRNMPSPPIFCNVMRQKRPAEIDHQVYSHDPGNPQGHVRIPGKIAVELEGKKEKSQQDLESMKGIRVVVYGVHKYTKPVGDDHFLKKTPKHQLNAGYEP